MGGTVRLAWGVGRWQAAETSRRATGPGDDDPGWERMQRRLGVMDSYWRAVEERAELVIASPARYEATEVAGWGWTLTQAQQARRTIERWRREDEGQ